MSDHERMLVQIHNLLSRVARPHRCDDALPPDVQAGLWALGFAYSEQTPREELVSRLWARKRSLLLISMQPPPSAA